VPSLLDDPLHWRARAKEARAMAAMENDPSVKQRRLEIARSYDQIAEVAEQGARRENPERGAT